MIFTRDPYKYLISKYKPKNMERRLDHKDVSFDDIQDFIYNLYKKYKDKEEFRVKLNPHIYDILQNPNITPYLFKYLQYDLYNFYKLDKKYVVMLLIRDYMYNKNANSEIFEEFFNKYKDLDSMKKILPSVVFIHYKRINVDFILKNEEYLTPKGEWTTFVDHPQMTEEIFREKILPVYGAIIRQELSEASWITWDIINRNRDFPWSFPYLSQNPKITPEIVKANSNEQWSYGMMSTNPSLTWEFIWENKDKDWCWISLSMHICVTMDIVRKHYDLEWRRNYLSRNPNFESSIINFEKQDTWKFEWDYGEIVKNPNVTLEFVEECINNKEIKNLHQTGYPPRFHQYKFSEIYKNPFTRHHRMYDRTLAMLTFNKLDHNLSKDIKRYIADNFL